MLQNRFLRLTCISGAFCAAALAETGPSTATPAYVIPTAAGVRTVSILTTGDSVNNLPDGVTPYRLAGIPDGMGAYDNCDGTFTLLVNHELGATSGRVRDHGGTGAFVSKWTIDKDTFAVSFGEDLIKRVFSWNGAAYFQNPARNIGRLCSADLPDQSAFYNAATGNGTQNKIYMNGEEIGDEGKAYGTIVDGPAAGDAYELPRLGKFSWENSVAAPNSGDVTVVMGMDDSTPGEVYVYVGTKTNTGNDIERAGLTNGNLYGIIVNGDAFEPAAGWAGSVPFTMFNFGNVENTTGAALQANSIANGVTRFARPEDGQFNPNNPNEYYWVTTGGTVNGNSLPNRLFRFTFTDINNPTLGGTLEMLLNGTEGTVSADNMTVENGRVFIQEDPGSATRLAKIWQYDIASDSLLELAAHDTNYFTTGAPNFLTTNEESSGIISLADILGRGWYAINVQAHFGIPGELVEGGQLLLMYTEQNQFARGDMNCDGFISVGDIAGFVLALTDPAGYAAQFCGCDINNADTNFDGFVSVGDIASFVAAVTGG